MQHLPCILISVADPLLQTDLQDVEDTAGLFQK